MVLVSGFTMSTYCNHFEYIPFDSRECEKALKPLKSILREKKKKQCLMLKIAVINNAFKH